MSPKWRWSSQILAVILLIGPHIVRASPKPEEVNPFMIEPKDNVKATNDDEKKVIEEPDDEKKVIEEPDGEENVIEEPDGEIEEPGEKKVIDESGDRAPGTNENIEEAVPLGGNKLGTYEDIEEAGPLVEDTSEEPTTDNP